MQINSSGGRVAALGNTRHFGLCALLTLAVLATSSAWGREANYVAPSKIVWELVLPPPPAPDSKAQQADLQAVLDAQRKRSKSEAEASRADAQISAFRIGDVLGPQFTAENLPFTAEFLRRATADMGDAITSSKKHFNRPRPYVVSNKVKPTIDPPGGGSYPSGHSMFAHLNGILIAAMVPERASEIFERAERYANHRIVAGVHFPTDVQAGRILASVIANALLQEPQFRADLQRATSEVRAALGLPELTARTE
jgi:acid phosphatase (class A)